MTAGQLRSIEAGPGREVMSGGWPESDDAQSAGPSMSKDAGQKPTTVAGVSLHRDSGDRAAFWPVGARRRGILRLAIIFGIYVGTVVLYPWSEGVAVVWLPNAVLVTALLKFRPRDWPYVYAAGLAAEVVGDLAFDFPPYQSLCIGIVNALEATLVVLLATVIARRPREVGLLSVRGALAIVLSSALVPALIGLLGAVFLSDLTFMAVHYLTAWRIWWFGDSMGLLVGVPIGLLFRDASRSIARRRSLSLAVGGGGVSLGLAILSGFLAMHGFAWGAQQTALGAAIFLALTFGAVGAPSAAIWTTSVTLIGLLKFQEDLGSVPRSQVLLFLALAAVYAIAAATEAAASAMDHVSRTQASLQSELDSAAAYVRNLMPRSLDGVVQVSSRYLPSRELGGDCFDFAWIDDDHLMFWLSDVSGHGVAPALVSVSVHDMLRSGCLGGEDNSMRPERVLTELNRRFAMEQHGGHYVTIWYGLYQRSSRTLTYGGAGHPPALLFSGGKVNRLVSQGPPVGMFGDTTFTSATEHIPVGARILLYSDGAFDLVPDNGTPFDLDDFVQLCTELNYKAVSNLEELVDELRSRTHGGQFQDDCSIVGLRFG
jgi:serine phosphatase RsbU (regulator of sigma subunit)